MVTVQEQLKLAKTAAPSLALASAEEKNRALLSMAEQLEAHTEAILAANAKDMEAAKSHITPVMLDRLMLTEARIHAMAEGIREVVKLPDPVGKVLREITRPNGLSIRRVSVPMGVVAMIFESRPNVTSDAAALAVKSGNACVLRTGKEAIGSAAAIAAALQKGLSEAGLSPDLVQLVEDPSRDGARTMMTAVGLVDLLIPRGGAGLIRSCVENATVPCIQTGTGICHIYVDASADLEEALSIIENAKTSRPSVCNAQEVCLVHKDIAKEFLPMLNARLTHERASAGKAPVELRLDARAQQIISGTAASDTDFDTEFLDYILAVGIVDSAEDAIGHIAMHSTGHSDGICTRDENTAALFTAAVDSAAVYVNASTRFTDGGEFGLGCEIGITTQKLHARGPMGLEELTTYKYVIRGSGHIR